jgi:hypothetical protein
MPHPGEPHVGGDADDRAEIDTLAETGPGLPDDAVGPEDRTIPEQMELSDSAEGRRIEQKLRAEAQARRGGDEDAAVEDPTGHA